MVEYHNLVYIPCILFGTLLVIELPFRISYLYKRFVEYKISSDVNSEVARTCYWIVSLSYYLLKAFSEHTVGPEALSISHWRCVLVARLTITLFALEFYFLTLYLFFVLWDFRQELEALGLGTEDSHKNLKLTFLNICFLIPLVVVQWLIEFDQYNSGGLYYCWTIPVWAGVVFGTVVFLVHASLAYSFIRLSLATRREAIFELLHKESRTAVQSNFRRNTNLCVLLCVLTFIHIVLYRFQLTNLTWYMIWLYFSFFTLWSNNVIQGILTNGDILYSPLKYCFSVKTYECLFGDPFRRTEFGFRKSIAKQYGVDGELGKNLLGNNAGRLENDGMIKNPDFYIHDSLVSDRNDDSIGGRFFDSNSPLSQHAINC